MMTARSARGQERTLLRQLDAPPPTGPTTEPTQSTVVRNAAGYPRTFSLEHDAWAVEVVGEFVQPRPQFVEGGSWRRRAARSPARRCSGDATPGCGWGGLVSVST